MSTIQVHLSFTEKRFSEVDDKFEVLRKYFNKEIYDINSSIIELNKLYKKKLEIDQYMILTNLLISMCIILFLILR